MGHLSSPAASAQGLPQGKPCPPPSPACPGRDPVPGCCPTVAVVPWFLSRRLHSIGEKASAPNLAHVRLVPTFPWTHAGKGTLEAEAPLAKPTPKSRVWQTRGVGARWAHHSSRPLSEPVPTCLWSFPPPSSLLCLTEPKELAPKILSARVQKAEPGFSAEEEGQAGEGQGQVPALILGPLPPCSHHTLSRTCNICLSSAYSVPEGRVLSHWQ